MNTHPVTRAVFVSAAMALGAFALSGCPNVANLTTARVIEPGAFEITAAPAVTGFSAGIFDSDESGTITAGTLDLGVRAGLAEVVDMGFRFSNMGNMNLDVKVGLLDSKSFRIALDPTIGGVFFGGEAEGGYMQLDLPVLFDLAFGERFTLSLAPRYTLLYFFADGSTSKAAHLAGGAIGFEVALGETFAIQPNAGVAFWVNGPDEVDTKFFSVGVAFKWVLGGSRFGKKEATASR